MLHLSFQKCPRAARRLLSPMLPGDCCLLYVYICSKIEQEAVSFRRPDPAVLPEKLSLQLTPNPRRQISERAELA